MLTGKLRNQVDKIWEAFWTGGISNPISVIEQFTYLLFIRRLDDIHTQREQVANAIGVPLSNPVFTPGQDALRWHKFKNIDPQKMYERVRDEVFPFIKNLHDADSTFAQHMKDAIFMIPKASVLDQVVQLIDQLDLRDRDTNGDLYEYMLSKLSSAGTNGQFRTPRHIIRLMVALTAPVLDGDKSDTICDPAAGTCGFLMAAEEYVRARYGDPVLRHDNDSHFHNRMFTGFDFDQHMLRIGAMNLLLHGVNNPTVAYRDSLSDHGEDNIREAYSLILANPPFKGSVAYDELSPDLLSALGKSPKKAQTRRKTTDSGDEAAEKKGPSEKSELLFLALILRLLKTGGRAGVIVPDGVLFGSTKSHQAIRQTLVEQHKLEAVISMPSGVFKPYAGVSTAILLFTKTGNGGTDDVWFYDMRADGWTLDDKRNELLSDAQQVALNRRLLGEQGVSFEAHAQCNLPDILDRWFARDGEKGRARSEQSFLVPKAEIVGNGYDLSINRYKQVIYEDVQYEAPQAILTRIKELQRAMDEGIAALEGML
ncbi:N-6 DNA methylase [Pseudomonas sp. HLS-6]|uniref:type I restriction-modification system subunit M n=1 Tax=Pseudomonas sp. HLS-6 TaxID=2049589 RepID=UPI000C19E6C9|nr:class I SAM-dependent DNA methyltransferase [Pseudomonas sp. HLS-6]ATR81717.1 N-6 DNA methylase [Pseudomonas sp. HLS-6]